MPVPSASRTSRVRRSTLIPVLLLIYLAVMSYIGWPNYASGETSALYYFGTIGVTLAIIILLHFNLKRRETLRARRLADMGRGSSTSARQAE